MKFGRSHSFFGCDIMNYFIFSLFVLLLFDSPQASTVAHRRSIRALNTTLETDFDGTYERRNPCTNAEVEKSSYKASHEFRHYSKESNWSEYSRKCTSIISGFLQAIGNLVRFNNEQNGIFNFHINTSISQKQDRHSDSCQEKLCPPLPTIIIEATDGDISQTAPLKNERPCVRVSNCSITGHSENGVTEIKKTVYPNQEEDSQTSTCKPTNLNSLEKEPLGSKFCPTAPKSCPETTSTYSQDATDTNPKQPVRQREAVLNQGENVATTVFPQIASSPLQFPFPGIPQTEVISPAALTDTQKYPPQSDFYGTVTRPESSPKNYDANVITTQPGNEIRIPNDIEPSPTETSSLDNQSKPGPAYPEKSDAFNSLPAPSTISGRYNDGTTANIPGTTENIPVYQSDEPRTTTVEDQLIANQYQPGQQPTNIIPEQRLSDSLGGQEPDIQPLANSFTPVDQFPTTFLPPEDRFNPLNRELESPSTYPDQISAVSEDPQVITRPNIEDLTFEQEITPGPDSSPNLSDLAYTKTPSVPEPAGISQSNFLPNEADPFLLPLPNSVQTVKLNPASPGFIPPPQQPQNDLLSTNPQILAGNKATTPDQPTTAISEYDELSNQRLVTQPPQGEETSSNTKAKPSSDGVPTPFTQLPPIQLGSPEKIPTEVPSDSLTNSPTFTPQPDTSNGPSEWTMPITGQQLNDNQASDPAAPGQFSDNKYYPPLLLPEGQDDFSFETQQTTSPHNSEPILNENTDKQTLNIPTKNTGEELPGNPPFISSVLPDTAIPSNNQFAYSDPIFNPAQETTSSYNDPAFKATEALKVQPPQHFPSTTVIPQWQSSPNYSQSQPSTSETYVNETVTTVPEIIIKAPFGQFTSTLPPEQPSAEIYETEQPQFTTVGPREQPQTPVPELDFADDRSPDSDFYSQRTPTFVQPESLTGNNAPFPLFPSNNSPEQQPAENYNIEQSQTTSADSSEDSQPKVTDAPLSSVDNGDGRTTSFPDLYNQQTPNAIIQPDSQDGGNLPLDQFPSNLPYEQQPLGNYEEENPQIATSGSFENLQLETNEDPKFVPPVEPTFYDQQNPTTFLPTQSPIEADIPLEQLPTTTSPGEQSTENSETEVESNDDPQNQEMASEFQPALDANNRIITLPNSGVYSRQIPERFLPSESQLGVQVPLDQIPSTEFAEQQPEFNNETMQSQPTPVATYEDPKLQIIRDPESQLVSENSEEATTRLPDPVSYNVESPNTFGQPDSKLETNTPFNQSASKEVQTESTTTQSETTVRPPSVNADPLSPLPAFGEINQEIPTAAESQEPVGNDQMIQSTSTQMYEDYGMQTTIGPELQPVPEHDDTVPDSFVQPDSQFGDALLPNQFPGNLPTEQSLEGNSDMDQGQTISPDLYAAPEPQTSELPESLPSREYGNDQLNESPNFYNQQYPSTSIIPNDYTAFPSTLAPEQQPVGNNDFTQPQVTSVSTSDNETTTTEFPTTEEPRWQPSSGSADQYLNTERIELPASGVINQQIPTTFSETESTVSSDAPFDRFPSTFSPDSQSTSELSYEDPQIQGTEKPDLQSSLDYTDDRANVFPTSESEQNASTSIPSDSEPQDDEFFNQIQRESQLKSNEPFDQTPSIITPKPQSSENNEIAQPIPISVATSEDPRLQATTGSEPQPPSFYSNETTASPNFNFNNQQLPIDFGPTESRLISNRPFDQFTFPPRQQPVGIYETEQFQPITVPSQEEHEEQTTVPSQTESKMPYSDAKPIELPDQQTPDTFVQPVPQFKDNSPFFPSPSTPSPEEQPIGNYEIPQTQNATVGTYDDQTIATEVQTTAAPQWQPFEDDTNGGKTELPISGIVNLQTPNVFTEPESGIPTNAVFSDLPSTEQENQADDAISPERFSEMEDPTSPALAVKPETFPSTLEISNEETSPSNIQSIVGQNDFQGAMNPSSVDSNQNSGFTAQTQDEDPSSTSYQNQPQINNQSDLFSNTEILSDVPLTTLAPGNESSGNPEETFTTSPLDIKTSVDYEDPSMTSSAFVSPYPGQVLNNDVTTAIPNIAFNSEETAPIIGADSPADISNPRETVNPTDEHGNSFYTEAENPLFVNENLPYGFAPTVKPYFRDEQSQMTTSNDPSVSSTDQFPENNYPNMQDPVQNQNSSENLGQSQPESEMSKQTSDVYPPEEPVEYVPAQSAQFPDDDQSAPQEISAVDQPNTDFSTVSSTSDTSLYDPQSTDTISQPIPFIPEDGPEADSQIPNEYDGKSSIADPRVDDDFSQAAERKFSPRPILVYGNETPSLANPETTPSPSDTTYSEDISESQSEQFSPEDSSTLLPPNEIPSDFENPETELQRSIEIQPSGSTISATPEPTVPEEAKTPDSLADENENQSQEGVNQYSGYPNQLYTGPLQPTAFNGPNIYTQSPPEPLNPSLESQNLQQPSNQISSQVPDSEEPVISDFSQNENQPFVISDEIPEPQWKVPENPQPAEELYKDGQSEEVKDVTSSQQPSTVYPMNYQPLLEQHMTPESNSRNTSADSVVTAQPTSAQTVSDYDGNVSYSPAQPRSELESQSLISTAGNDQPLPGTIQPYVPELQTETTLPYSNDPSVDFKPSFADSETNPLSSPSPLNEVRNTSDFGDTSSFYADPSVTSENSSASDPSDFVTVDPPRFQPESERVDDSLSLQPINPYDEFTPAVSPNPNPLMFPDTPTYDDPLATTDYPSLPSEPSPSETPADSYTVNPNAFDPRNESKTQETEEYQTPAPISGSNIPLNDADQTPLAMVGAIPSRVPQVSFPFGRETPQPTLKSWNAQEVTPEPQPQPSLENTTEIQDYETAEGLDQTSTTFDNTSPPQLNPEEFGTSDPNPAITFQPERQTPFTYTPDTMNSNGDYPLPDTPRPQSSDEESNKNFSAPTIAYSSDDTSPADNIRSNPAQDTELQNDYGTSPPNQAFPTLPVEAPISSNILGQYDPQTIQEAPELPDSVSPQILPNTSINYDEETNTYQSSPAPQPQTILNNMDQLSSDDTPSISPDNLEISSPKFEPTPTFTSQTTNPEFPDRDTEFPPVPQSQPTEEYPGITYDQQPPSTVFAPSTIGQTDESDISFPNQPDNYYSGMETNERVPKQPEPEISPNPQETFNQTVQPVPPAYAEQDPKSRETDFPGDFSSFSSPFERPSQAQVPVTDYGNTREEISDFPPNYQPQLVDTETQPEDTPAYNEQSVDPQENIATDFSEVTNPLPEAQLTNTDNIINGDELRPIPEGTILPREDNSTLITESSSYSDPSVYNVRKRPNGRLFDISTLPQSEGNNDQQAQYSSPLMSNDSAENPEQSIVLDDTTSPTDYYLSTQSPEAVVSQYDKAPQEEQNVPAMRQPFDNKTEQPGLYNSQLGVPAQPQTDSPLDFEEGSTRRPMTSTPNSESFANPSPPMQEEPHSNPLFETLESHLIVPLPEPQQPSATSSSSSEEPLYLDPTETSPIPNDFFSFDQSNQNRFSTIPPNFRRPEFDQNFVTSQPQPNAGDVMNTPQSDSQALVSDLTTPSNKPGEDYVSCSYKGSCPIMCPFDPVLKGNMTAPSYYILISKLPAQDNKEENYRVEKVYLGDGTPLNCSFSAGKTFPTSLYTPVQLRSTGTVKLRTKRKMQASSAFSLGRGSKTPLYSLGSL